MKKILIVDDDEFMAEVYRENLQAHGFAAEVSPNGLNGMVRLKNSPPDLVVLDLMLPDIDGIRVLKYIRALPAIRTLPVVILTNAYMGEAVKAAYREGVNKCLTKAVCPPRHLAKEIEHTFAETGALPPSVALPIVGAFRSVPDSLGDQDPERFQAEFRRNLKGKLAEQLQILRQQLHAIVKSDRDAQTGLTMKLYRAAHSLTGLAGLAGLAQMARLSSALELLLMDLQRSPARMNQSSLKTVAQGIDILGLLHERVNHPPEKPALSPLILVVDDEPIARESICAALENVHLRAVSLGEPAVALQLAAENAFDLVFLDADMPGQNGFQLCERIRETPGNRSAFVVFVTAHADFENRAQSNRSGGNDFISKSASPYEIGVKAMSYLLNPSTPPHEQRAAA